MVALAIVLDSELPVARERELHAPVRGGGPDGGEATGAGEAGPALLERRNVSLERRRVTRQVDEHHVHPYVAGHGKQAFLGAVQARCFVHPRSTHVRRRHERTIGAISPAVIRAAQHVLDGTGFTDDLVPAMATHVVKHTYRAVCILDHEQRQSEQFERPRTGRRYIARIAHARPRVGQQRIALVTGGPPRHIEAIRQAMRITALSLHGSLLHLIQCNAHEPHVLQSTGPARLRDRVTASGLRPIVAIDCRYRMSPSLVSTRLVMSHKGRGRNIAASPRSVTEPVLDRGQAIASNTRPCGQVAQSVEQGTENPRVGGSILSLATKFSSKSTAAGPSCPIRSRATTAIAEARS